jgi:ketosteroid isomerase-like protein
MHKIFIELAVIVLAAASAASAAASDKQDVMAVVQQWVDAFNKDDSNMQVATCAAETSIIDDMPPHEWHGAGACAKWKNDLDAFAKKLAVTGLTAATMKPRHVDVSAESAYVVVPVNLTYKQRGKDMKDTGLFTVALHKGASGWRITGWAWAEH